MKITTVITQANGVISLVLQPAFVGDMTDGTDKALIAAYGDPQVNLAGNFADPNDPTFTFQFPTTELYVGVSTQLSTQISQFMLALPQGSPNSAPAMQGAMQCITPNPSRAATVWQGVIVTRITQALAALRAKTLVPTIPPISI